MVKLILWFLGLAIIALSVTIILQPQMARRISERLNETGYAVSAWARVIIGLILLLIADTRAWNILFNALGVLMVLAGAYMLHIGFERSKALALRIAGGNENFLRAMAAVGVLLGLLLISAS
ncbi:hypothetical protein [Microbulbifer thermotolerans]|uniref:Uncharacterized protein n=1 Tax=Microbulbifer thermotolerans TaxID=252514 RepID=A0A143HQ58_MICTH|nr:hypothetical protein [Microbulbifer thermotolerans]AMX03641.1 hypothetical protein A3224_14565 [Microbulbifer thermotolerans]MCX2802577.1 hypothetical protein [Microbulbifer thermotolerans]